MSKVNQRIAEIKKKGYYLLGIKGKFIEYEDGNGYKYRREIYGHGEIGEGHRYRLDNPYCIDNINLSLKKTESGTVIKPETYNGAKNKCTFICGKCGREFSCLLPNLLRYKYCLCATCVREIQETRLLEIDKIKEELRSYDYELLNDTWSGYHDRIDVEDGDGYKGRTKFDTLRKGGSFSRFALYNPYSLDNVKLFCKLNGFTCTIPNQRFGGWDNNIKVLCECGNLYHVELSKLINGHQSRCPECAVKVSKIESEVGLYLEKIGVSYCKQKIFSDCRYKKPLPFDFYLPDFNIAIEVQGEQHYKPVEGFGGEKAFELQQKKDKIKKDYCNYTGIHLMCLSYYDVRSGKYKAIIDKATYNE